MYRNTEFLDRNFDRAVDGTQVTFLNALNSFTAWLITHLEVSSLIMGFSYLQTSGSDVDLFYLNFYIWSNKTVWAVQSCYTLILSKE